MSIRIIEDGPEIVLPRSEYERLNREWQENCRYMVGAPSFETWLRSRLQPRQAIALPVIDPSLLEVGK